MEGVFWGTNEKEKKGFEYVPFDIDEQCHQDKQPQKIRYFVKQILWIAILELLQTS